MKDKRRPIRRGRRPLAQSRPGSKSQSVAVAIALARRPVRPAQHFPGVSDWHVGYFLAAGSLMAAAAIARVLFPLFSGHH